MTAVFLTMIVVPLLAACGAPDRGAGTAAPSAPAAIGDAPPTADELSAPKTDASLPAHAVVERLAQNGYSVPNALDVTAQLCPSSGCAQSIVTDTLRVTSFPSPQAAQRYARERGMRYWRNVVVTFPPVMPTTEQDKYWSAIVRLFP